MKKILKFWWVLLILVPIIFTVYMIISSKNTEQNRKMSMEYADKLVLQPDGNYSIELMEDIKKRLSLIPYKYLSVLYDKQVFIKGFNGPITDAAEFTTYERLRKSKSGYEQYNGVFIYESNSIIIRTDEKYSPGVEVHEVGHAVDLILFNDISSSKEFKDIFNIESSKFFTKTTDEYFTTNTSEYFAQAFFMYYYNYDTRKELKSGAPETYKFIKKLESRKLSIR